MSSPPTSSATYPPKAISRPELLAPAGDRECIRAAIENGADAVYFGLDHGFNARARATNFPLAGLPEVMAELHGRGVKGYITLNTLAFADELPAIEQTVRALAMAGVDAVLVQDLGVVQLIRELCPGLSIHASTQMTLTSAECLRAAESLGIERVVLARELSLDEIRKIRSQTSLPIEVFVHGALCVAYSGQCLTSESLGGRSANRGQCAQACRLPYDLVCDNRDVDLGDQKYLLSPQDLAAYALIPELIAVGVCSFKIEGRLKTPEYVANITRHYRRAIDEAWEGCRATFTTNDIREMELSFSRGFSTGWLQGNNHKVLVPALSSAKRGVLVGKITGIHRGRVTVDLEAPLAAGDGIVFEGNRELGEEQGGRVFEIRQHGHVVDAVTRQGIAELTFQRERIDLPKLHVGQKLWKTDDPQLTSRLRATFRGPDPIRKIPLRLQVTATIGQPLHVSGAAASGSHCSVTSDQPLERARNHPITKELVVQQLGRLGGTPFQLTDLDLQLGGQPMVPLSVLGAMRREMVRQLNQSCTGRTTRPLAEPGVLDRLRAALPHSEIAQPHPSPLPVRAPELRVLCRSRPQLDILLTLNVSGVYADFQDIREYREAVKHAHSHRVEIQLATPRIQKPGERGIFLALAKHDADGILVRNLSGLDFFAERGVPTTADFSLNVTNDLTAHLLRRRGAQRITPSYDLNRDQLLTLVEFVPPSWLEVVAYQHMPMFHMEHCVFCAVLSPGTNQTNCGRPCDRHNVHLRDRIGMEHPLKADVGCRNTLFNAVPQSAAEVVPQLLERQIGSYRIELLDESESEIRHIVELYQQLLSGSIRGADVWKQLRAANRVGVTRGTLEERRNPLAIL